MPSLIAAEAENVVKPPKNNANVKNKDMMRFKAFPPDILLPYGHNNCTTGFLFF